MSLQRLREHRSIWDAKPVLADVYAVWFEELVRLAAPAQRVLEVGAGPGLLGQWARGRRPDLRWIASDLLPASSIEHRVCFCHSASLRVGKSSRACAPRDSVRFSAETMVARA